MLSVFLLFIAGAAWADGFRVFEGHGGPVNDVALSADGTRLLTASFDYSVGLWRMDEDTDPVWLDGHDAAVNTVAFLPGDRAVSGSDDLSLILWDLKTGAALHHLNGHTAKVTTVAVSPDGGTIASASWDGTVRLWDGDTGEPLGVLRGDAGYVNDVIWAGDGARLYSAHYDGTVLAWDVAARAPLGPVARYAFGINVLAIDEAAGWLAYGALDGGTKVIDLETHAELADLTTGRRPILALTRSRDGRRIAISDGEGYLMVVQTAGWKIERDFHAALDGPIWALSFTGSGSGIVAGGMMDQAFLWPLDGSDSSARMAELRREFDADPGEVSNGELQFLRKCSICHTLGPDGERRAGPSLAGIFGRPAGSFPGYKYSPALTGSDIVWSDKTIDRLFEVGPDTVTPGSKMPMQQIGSAADRADLIGFLKRETARK